MLIMAVRGCSLEGSLLYLSPFVFLLPEYQFFRNLDSTLSMLMVEG